MKDEFRKHIVIGSKHISIRAAERQLKTILDGLHLADTQEHNILVATSEALNNAVAHGNKNDPDKEVSLDVQYRNSSVTIEVLDQGRGFNLSRLPDPLLPENLLKPSGRGIHIMKSLMDSVAFDFTPAGTKIILKLKVRKSNK